MTLTIGAHEARGFAAELLEQNGILLLEVFDNEGLVCPAGVGEEELAWSSHGAKNPKE